MKNVVTDRHQQRCFKHCLCCVCGEVHECTPSFDFYTTNDHGDELVCEKCFRIYLHTKHSIGKEAKEEA